jgi:hypothetical protein
MIHGPSNVRNKVVSGRNTGLDYKTMPVLIGIKMHFGCDRTQKKKVQIPV